MSEKIRVFKVTMMVVDFDRVGSKEIERMIEETKYANHSIAPLVESVKSVEYDWDDECELNKRGWETHFRRLFEK